MARAPLRVQETDPATLRAAARACHFPPPTTLPTRAPRTMQPAAILTFVLIAGFIWGGLVLTLSTAIRKERHKRTSE